MTKYENKKWIDLRDGCLWVVVSCYKGGRQTKYWIESKRPKGKKVLKKWCEFESTLTKLQKYLKEVE